MYTIFSNYFGQMTTKNTLDDAKQWVNCMKIKFPYEVFSIWFNGQNLYEA